MKIRFVIIVGLLLSACAALPRITLIEPDQASVIRSKCQTLFPQGKWQFTHSIEASLPGDRHTTMIGVTRISTADHKIDCVMMTIEGLVLFEGGWDGEKVVIRRGVPPFDKKTFARGMLDDIRLIFFHPQATAFQSGELENGNLVCRYSIDRQITQDIIISPDGSWMLRQYDNKHPIRTVRASENAEGVQAPEITLQAKGDYSLRLKLIQAHHLEASP